MVGQHDQRGPPRGPTCARRRIGAGYSVVAIASSGVADAALVDLGALVECDAQETGCLKTTRAARTDRDCRHERSPARRPKGRPSGRPLESVTEPCRERRHDLFVHCDRGPHGRLRRYLLPASAFANASLQPSLMSGICSSWSPRSPPAGFDVGAELLDVCLAGSPDRGRADDRDLTVLGQVGKMPSRSP